MTWATTFAEREHQICTTARLIEAGRSYWTAGSGSPLQAILLARRLYVPDVLYVTEDGAIDPRPALPFDPMVSMVSSRSGYKAAAWSTMNLVGYHAAAGYFDYGILNTLQIDRYGNINSSMVGRSYERPQRRFGGAGGATAIASLCWRTIVMTDLDRRKFVDRVDFITSPGYLDGTPEARERAGMPRETGPWRVVTPWAVFGYDDQSRQMQLLAISPWVTVDQVLGEMGFAPLVAEPIAVLDPPTEEELAILRTELDPRGQTTGRSPWVDLSSIPSPSGRGAG